MAIIDDLERLAQLHERGVLTDEEFNREKRKLLDAPSSGNDNHTSDIQTDGTQLSNGQSDRLRNMSQHSDSILNQDTATPKTISNDTSNPPLAPKKKNKAFRRIVYVLLILVVCYVLLRMLIYMPVRDTIRDAVIQRPVPVVVWQQCNDDNANLFEYRITVNGKVRNTGADGYVAILVTVTQDGREYHRRDRRYLRTNEEASVSFTFDEPDASGSNSRCNVNVIASE